LKRTDEVYKYEVGTNPTIDRFTEADEEVWIVQSSAGRRPVIVPLGSTADDAYKVYAEQFLTK
jgi:hypothetical protein